MPFSEVYRKQLQLLIRTLPLVADEDCFALEGGTAINLFYRDLPRLAVDIDLAYLPVAQRQRSLREIETALKRIAGRVRERDSSITVEGIRARDSGRDHQAGPAHEGSCPDQDRSRTGSARYNLPAGDQERLRTRGMKSTGLPRYRYSSSTRTPSTRAPSGRSHEGIARSAAKRRPATAVNVSRNLWFPAVSVSAGSGRGCLQTSSCASSPWTTTSTSRIRSSTLRGRRSHSSPNPRRVRLMLREVARPSGRIGEAGRSPDCGVGVIDNGQSLLEHFTTCLRNCCSMSATSSERIPSRNCASGGFPLRSADRATSTSIVSPTLLLASASCASTTRPARATIDI